MMNNLIKVRYENGVLVPIRPISGLENGDVLEFCLPDAEIVYLCETDRQAALENGRVIWTVADEHEGKDSNDASSDS